jgi:Tfp pilus assembly protein PilF
MRGAVSILFAMTALALQDPYAEGMKALDAKEYAAAVAIFEKLAAEEPESYAAHFHLALAQSLAGNGDAAVAHYRKTLELKPGLYEAEMNLGVLLFERKSYAEALPLLESAARTKPDNAVAAAAAGRAQMELGKLDEAEAHLRKAAELDASQKDMLLELAQRWEEAKKPERALALYKEFAGRPGVAERMGNLMLQEGQAAAAVERLEAAVKESPTAANRYALAIAYLRSNEAGKAAGQFEQAVKMEPRNVELRMAYGRLLRDQRQIAPAANQFYAAVQIRPEFKEAWSEFAAMLLLLERYEQALGAFEKVEQLGEEGAAVHFFKAIAQDRLKLFKPAKASYEKFLSLSAGKYPDEEFKARQRIKVLEKELARR